MAEVVEKTKLILSDAVNNNNKFWMATLYADHSVFVEWGRVGYEGQNQTKQHSSEGQAKAFIASKRREKEAKGYSQLNVVETSGEVKVSSVSGKSLEDTAAEEIGGSDKRVQALVRYLTKTNVHNITSSTTMKYNATTGLFSTPMGVVTQGNIDNARLLLSDMADFVSRKAFQETKYLGYIGDYLRLIPQNVGMKIDPQLYPDLDAIQKQNAILDSLQASLDQLLSSAKKPVTAKVGDKPAARVFNVKIALIEDKKEIDRIRAKYKETLHRNHACAHLDVSKVYDVSIAKMDESFEKDGMKLKDVRPGGIMELWHGTRVANVLSIAHKGMVIPPANAGHCTGRMFGNGLYFSDQSTKSLNYAYGYWGGGSADDNCFMFLVDVAMGNYYVPKSSNEHLPRAGFDSTFAKGQQSGVMNNEMIVYRVGQSRIKRLIEFAPKR